MKQRIDRARVGQRLFQALFLVLVGLQVLLSYDVRLGFTVGQLGVLGAGLLLFGMYVVGLVRLAGERKRVRELDGMLAHSHERNEALHLRLVQRGQGVKSAEELEEDRQALAQELLSSLEGQGKALLESYYRVLGKEWQLVQGLAYVADGEGVFRPVSTYAYYSEGGDAPSFRLGETLTGQVVKEGAPLFLSDLPAGYRIVTSGLGRGVPTHLYILPLRGSGQGKVYGAVELAFFQSLREADRHLIVELTEALGSRYAG